MTASRPPRRRGPATRAGSPTPTSLHPRNRHQGRYDFAALVAASPALAPFLLRTPAGETSIDFGSPDGVRALNRALLAQQYGIRHWDIPPGYLCPPVPGRADYLHGLADLLAEGNRGVVPTGPSVRVLDIGVGANLIYPLIGQREYGWSFVGTEVDPDALAVAAAIARANGLEAAVELRLQHDRRRVFDGVLRADDRFDASLCNPPFHASAREAALGSTRKWINLGKPQRPGRPALNFGGQEAELWCAGGEAGFLRRMIDESASMPDRVRWYSSLVSKREHVAPARRQLEARGARQVRVVPMAQGSKQSRFIAWTFLGG